MKLYSALYEIAVIALCAIPL